MKDKGIAFVLGFMFGRVGWPWIMHFLYLMAIVLLVVRRFHL